MITNATMSELFEKLETIEIQSSVGDKYNRKTFWDKVLNKEPVIAYNSQAIATATKNMIGGMLNKEDNAEIIDLVLKLAFYVVDGDDARFVYENMLTFENFRLSEKVFGSNTRRKVFLNSNNWFDQWKEFAQNDCELDLIQYLQQPLNIESITHWGPWLATTILCLGNESATNVAKKIETLFSKFYCQYRGLGLSFPKINVRFWENILKSVQIVDLDEPKKNTLYWAMINVYHAENTPKAVIDLLNLTMIPSLRFKHMELITLIDEFSRKVGCGQGGALMSCLSIETRHSWKIYVQIIESYLNPNHPLGEDKLWPYVREFDSTVFKNLSYEENYKLCNTLAIIIDLNESPCYSYMENIGPTFAKLISKKSVNVMTEKDFERCKKIYDLLIKKEQEIAENVACRSIARIDP